MTKEVTIDDVVKFMHDDIENVEPGMFPYTTWDEIPEYEDANNGEICKTNDSSGKSFISFILLTPSYTIGLKSPKIG